MRRALSKAYLQDSLPWRRRLRWLLMILLPLYVLMRVKKPTMRLFFMLE
jgi:hypothetical protein